MAIDQDPEGERLQLSISAEQSAAIVRRQPNESHDQSVIRALEKLDPQLAGLFRHGRELCARTDEIALVYLIAHAGRELIRGVVRELEDGTAVDTSSDDELATSLDDTLQEVIQGVLGAEVPSANVRDLTTAIIRLLHERGEAEEDFPRRIGNALELRPNHPTVKRWSNVHRTFQRGAHYRMPGPSISSLRSAFAELAELLFGRVGPIFDTETELDRLTTIEIPSPEDIDRVRRLVPRPAQRRHFFDRLHSPHWIEPLQAAGLFGHFPEREVFPDGSWRMRLWPEGEYLVRMATARPDLIVERFKAVPPSIMNPMVWGQLAKAMLALPVEYASKLVPNLIAALQSAPPVFFPHLALEVAISLARKGKAEAFKLAEALLWPRSNVDIPPKPAEESWDTYITTLVEEQRKLRHRDDWALARIEAYDLGQITKDLIPALELIDAKRTITLVAQRLSGLINRVAAIRRTYVDALMRLRAMKSTDSLDEPDTDFWLDSGMKEEGESRLWCDNLKGHYEYNDVRALMVTTLLEMSQRIIKSGVLSTEEILVVLDSFPQEIFRRTQIQILADQSTLTDSLHHRVDTILRGDDIVWPPFGARETAALLRTHFTSASEAAQQSFVAKVEDGPDDRSVTANIQFWERADTPEERADVIAQWQRVRIRWFHDRVPPLLVPLAERLGIVAAIPTAQQQSLDETGSWSGGVYSGGYRSPITPDALNSMTASEFVQYLATWKPGEGFGDPFENPSREGLETTITGSIAENPSRITEIRAVLESRSIHIGYLRAILYGLHSAIQQLKPVPVGDLLWFAQHTWKVGEHIASDDVDGPIAVWAATAVCDTVSALMKGTTTHASDVEGAWTLVQSSSRSELLWRDPHLKEVCKTFSEARNQSTSPLCSRFVETVVDVAWRDFMLEHPAAAWPPPQCVAGPKAVLLIESLLNVQQGTLLAVQGAVGSQFLRLIWLASEWASSNAQRFFEGGAEHPALRPAWGMYLTDCRFTPPSFSLLRPWYAVAASMLPADGKATDEDPEWTLGKILASHVMLGIVHGLCHPGDTDDLVANTFNRVPVETRAYSYWEVYRGWRSSTATNVASLSPRVIEFWEWRLTVLEALTQDRVAQEEVDGLCVFIATLHLMPEDVIRLGKRTVALLRKKHRASSFMWERLAELSEVDPTGAFDIAERMIELSMADDHVYLPFDDAAPSLRAAIRAGGSLRDRALALVDRLGELDLVEYRELWNESQQLHMAGPPTSISH